VVVEIIGPLQDPMVWKGPCGSGFRGQAIDQNHQDLFGIQRYSALTRIRYSLNKKLDPIFAKDARPMDEKKIEKPESHRSYAKQATTRV